MLTQKNTFICLDKDSIYRKTIFFRKNRRYKGLKIDRSFPERELKLTTKAQLDNILQSFSEITGSYIT